MQGDELDRISTAFLKYSKVTGQDVSTAVEQVAMSMKAFNVDASEAGEVLDYIAQVSTATGISAQTLTADLNSNGSTLREMGLTLQDGVKLLGDFEAAGVPADQMLTGLKKAAANCAKENTNLSDKLRQLVADLQDPERQAKATQDAIDLFGSKAAMAFVDAARSGRVNLDDLGQSLDSAKGFVSDLKDETTTASDRVKGAVKKMTVAGSGIGEQFVPIVERAADAVTDAAEAIDGMSDGEREAAAGAVKAAAGLGGMLVVAGKTVKGMGSLGKTITTLSTTGCSAPRDWSSPAPQPPPSSAAASTPRTRRRRRAPRTPRTCRRPRPASRTPPRSWRRRSTPPPSPSTGPRTATRARRSPSRTC